MISSAAELVGWIHTNLPELDEDRYEPWRAEPATPGALTAHIHVRIRTPGRSDVTTSISLTAALITDEPGSAPPRSSSTAPTESR
ncbi:hypothetical protein ABZ540_35400 [Nocardia xishanensis]|uniref:hypothetical protein n=1 Tax=Nocardia xishanensis TaxID=238964 RepID=UPI0033D7735D